MRIFLLLLCLFPLFAGAQGTGNPEGELIDKIIAVVGGEIILYSDLETAALEMSEGKGMSGQEKCNVLENLLFQKLLLHQSRIDSVVVEESQVDAELNDRLNRVVAMFPSTDEFEKYYGKSLVQWKADLRDDIRDQALIREERTKVIGSRKITPAEVEEFYRSLPSDSLPLLNASVEYSQIVIKPEIKESVRISTRAFLDSIRTDVMNGRTSMTIQAARWSEDPGSKYKGGCYPLQPRGSFVPEYEAAVYNTPEGQYSPVFETEYGYHFVKVVEKRGEYYESCHILIAPKVLENDLEGARILGDTISHRLKNGTLTFGQAVSQYSTDERTKNQGGALINSQTGGRSFDLGDLPAEIFFIIDKLKPGQFSEPVLITLDDGNQAYVVYQLNSRTEAHRANMTDDYSIFKNQAEQEMQMKLVQDWVARMLRKTYTRVEADYAACKLEYPWGQNNP